MLDPKKTKNIPEIIDWLEKNIGSVRETNGAIVFGDRWVYLKPIDFGIKKEDSMHQFLIPNKKYQRLFVLRWGCHGIRREFDI